MTRRQALIEQRAPAILAQFGRRSGRGGTDDRGTSDKPSTRIVANIRVDFAADPRVSRKNKRCLRTLCRCGGGGESAELGWVSTARADVVIRAPTGTYLTRLHDALNRAVG